MSRADLFRFDLNLLDGGKPVQGEEACSFLNRFINEGSEVQDGRLPLSSFVQYFSANELVFIISLTILGG